MTVCRHSACETVPAMGWQSSDSVERVFMAAVGFGGLVAIVGLVLLMTL